MKAILIALLAFGLAACVQTPQVAQHQSGVNLAAMKLAQEPDYAHAKLATLRYESNVLVCSATAIAPHKVLTAAHCVENLASRALGIRMIDQSKLAGLKLGGRTARVSQIDLDSNDAAILTTDLYFTHTAKFGPKPEQGDVVFSFGNPSTTKGVLLVGLVAGWVGRYMGVDNVMLVDRNDWYGCSGAAVFDAQGRIVGVVNSIFPYPNDGWRLTGVYPLTFTPEQLI